MEKENKLVVSIVGASGFIGGNLYEYLNSELQNCLVHGTYFSNKFDKNFDFLDVTDKKLLENYITTLNPDFLIWLTGWKPMECKRNYSSAINLHVKPIINLIEIINRHNMDTKIIFMSSDYVFDGRLGMYTDDTTASPVTNYGKLKGVSEQLLLTLNDNSKVIRSSAVMGKGGVFFDWALAKIRGGENIEAFSDICFSPTPIRLLEETIKKIILNYNDFPQPLIHVSGGKRMSRYEFIKLLATSGDFDSENIIGTTRPSLEDSNSIESLFGKDLSLVPSEFVKNGMSRSFEDYIREELNR